MTDKCFISCCIKTESEDDIENNGKIYLKPRIPRPPNAFMLYANENRKIMSQQYPAESNKDISKKLGSTWKSLDKEEKDKYFEKARTVDLEHKKKYPNYIYNPKEARIRKAMREAASRDRDRSIGGSPMLARPSARRAPPSHGWTPAPHEELMMSPLPSGMRAGLDSPCYQQPTATAAGVGGGPFMASMSAAGSGYAAKLRQEAATAPQSASYMQQNPLTQLHQQTEMWHNFQDEMRPRSTSGNPFMMHQDLPSPYTSHHQPSPPLSIPSPHMMDQQHRHTPHSHTPHPLHQLTAISMPMTPPHSNSNMSMTPPHCNENVPPHSNENVSPDEWAKVAPEDGGFGEPKPGEGGQPLAESNGGFAGLYGGEQQVDGGEERRKQVQVQQQQVGDKAEGVRQSKKMPDSSHTCHKNISNKHTMYLPLSCMKFCASPDLFTNNLDYQKEYIAKYFQNSAEYEVLNFATEDGGSFPYASAINTSGQDTVHLIGDSPQLSCIQGDLDYIPIIIDNKHILDMNNIKYH